MNTYLKRSYLQQRNLTLINAKRYHMLRLRTLLRLPQISTSLPVPQPIYSELLIFLSPKQQLKEVSHFRYEFDQERLILSISGTVPPTRSWLLSASIVWHSNPGSYEHTKPFIRRFHLVIQSKWQTKTSLFSTICRVLMEEKVVFPQCDRVCSTFSVFISRIFSEPFPLPAMILLFVRLTPSPVTASSWQFTDRPNPVFWVCILAMVELRYISYSMTEPLAQPMNSFCASVGCCFTILKQSEVLLRTELGILVEKSSKMVSSAALPALESIFAQVVMATDSGLTIIRLVGESDYSLMAYPYCSLNLARGLYTPVVELSDCSCSREDLRSHSNRWPLRFTARTCR